MQTSLILITFAQLQRLPVSFHQLKELRWLDLKNNPLVSALAEAAGDCLDQKGCQEAAKPCKDGCHGDDCRPR